MRVPSQLINYLLPILILLSLYETKKITNASYPLLFGATNEQERTKQQNIHLLVQSLVITVMGLLYINELNTEISDALGISDTQPVNIVHFHFWMSVMVSLVTNGLNIFQVILVRKEIFFKQDTESLAERLQIIETIGRATIQKGTLARIGVHKNPKLKNRLVKIEMDLDDCPTTSDHMAIVDVTLIDESRQLKVACLLDHCVFHRQICQAVS